MEPLCLKLVMYVFSIGLIVPTIVTSTNDVEHDYYWQQYSGNIPHNALPGGVYKNGKTTYIGQVHLQSDAMVPGQIDASTKTLSYARGGKAYMIKENIMVLCVRHPERYEWIRTNATGVRFLTYKSFVDGGCDFGYPLLIGKRIWYNEIIVGKVNLNKEYEGIGFVANGKACHVRDSDYFEVLSYNPCGIVMRNCVDSLCPQKVYTVNFH